LSGVIRVDDAVPNKKTPSGHVRMVNQTVSYVRQNVDQDRTAPHRNAAEDLGQIVLTTRRRDGVEQEGDLTTTCDNQNRNFTHSLPSPRPSQVGGEGTSRTAYPLPDPHRSGERGLAAMAVVDSCLAG
jgi:hypothetical protein